MENYNGMGPGESWPLSWTPVEKSPVKRNKDYSYLLLPSELMIAEGLAVVLVNMDIAGTVLVTNYRLIFIGEDGKVVPLGTIPLGTIENAQLSTVKGPQQSTPRNAARVGYRGPIRHLLEVVGKDMRKIAYCFRPNSEQRESVFKAMTKFLLSPTLWDLYAFSSGLPPAFQSGDPMSRLHAEYTRILTGTDNKTDGPTNTSGSMRSSTPVKPGKSWWRISEVNLGYTMCATYPSRLIVPCSVSDEDIQQVMSFRARARIPAVVWRHGGNGAVLARSAQPLVGFLHSTRSPCDEKLLAGLCPPLGGSSSPPRKLYVADARPRTNAIANGALGGGTESPAHYPHIEVVFLGIENIHFMRESFTKLRDYLDTHGSASSDGSSSLLRAGDWAWGGASASSMASAVTALGQSGWLYYVHTILSNAAWIAGRVVMEGASVLVHCSDGWDRTTQLISLAQILLDPYYRTFRGFQALVEKDWLAFGHPFADRLGVPTFTGGNYTVEGLGHTPSESSAPVRNGPSSAFASSAPGAVRVTNNNESPVFLQWADCVAQLIRLYPRAFEFSLAFLVEFFDSVLSCRFGNFLCNSEKERVQANISDSTADIWTYLEKARSGGRAQHEHYNMLYEAGKHTGALLPPAAALTPSLWTEFYLRWSCPYGLNFKGCMPTGWGQGGDIENEARKSARSMSVLKTGKERAEMKLLEAQITKLALEEQLKAERQQKLAAITEAGQAQQETAALRRVLQAMGCKVRISKAHSGGNYSEGEILYEEDIEDKTDGSPHDQPDVDLNRTEPLAVSILLEGDSTAFHIRRACGVDGALSCSNVQTGDVCKWPQGRCARLGSAFLGLKADFQALQQLSILDCYFDPEHKGSTSSGIATSSQTPVVT
ncbi:hypothetical protein MPTK1_4g05600 [Marchantia polymorpha subsp. ruderalis]|uniref:Myotubularin phosphatase domain-containing protein n=2 Tax=Marchantia polymorpha TaxID=3197 RepID=A0AAF6B6P8_MARPO|nr:hypothetical protein MARPO_0087s0031 [Marchantia polymorpha]BBN07682.1 hypothetical protein Mp_4g05600 [Marchantia polymorpha subsp. ruderalis]|eukprot:PTQ33590.1 hypothetical protein MARPO_0087s0031 [Marchantia polymorpha]